MTYSSSAFSRKNKDVDNSLSIVMTSVKFGFYLYSYSAPSTTLKMMSVDSIGTFSFFLAWYKNYVKQILIIPHIRLPLLPKAVSEKLVCHLNKSSVVEKS